jgi:hypothetical protein
MLEKVGKLPHGKLAEDIPDLQDHPYHGIERPAMAIDSRVSFPIPNDPLVARYEAGRNDYGNQ